MPGISGRLPWTAACRDPCRGWGLGASRAVLGGCGEVVVELIESGGSSFLPKVGLPRRRPYRPATAWGPLVTTALLRHLQNPTPGVTAGGPALPPPPAGPFIQLSCAGRVISSSSWDYIF